MGASGVPLASGGRPRVNPPPAATAPSAPTPTRPATARVNRPRRRRPKSRQPSGVASAGTASSRPSSRAQASVASSPRHSRQERTCAPTSGFRRARSSTSSTEISSHFIGLLLPAEPLLQLGQRPVEVDPHRSAIDLQRVGHLVERHPLQVPQRERRGLSRREIADGRAYLPQLTLAIQRRIGGGLDDLGRRPEPMLHRAPQPSPPVLVDR